MDECRALDVALMVQLGGFRCVLGALRLLLRDSWQLSCRGTVGRAIVRYGIIENEYFT